MATVTVCDETFPGHRVDARALEVPAERVTVRELIRARVYQEVTERNAARTLARAQQQRIEPAAAERLLNGKGARPRLSWEQQYQRALHAFRHHGFLLLVDGQHCDDLDATIELRADTRITFLRLVPLVGG